MNILYTNKSIAFTAICLLLTFATAAQDKVYNTNGKVVEGKVTEVSPTTVKLTKATSLNGPIYILKATEVDSIIYSNGLKDDMPGVTRKRSLLQNIPQLNTWTFDVLGFAFSSVSQSYERRLKNGLVGFRVPLYIGFYGGGIAGVGTFTPSQGVIHVQDYGYGSGYGGFSMATGLNAKFYFFNRRIVRPFAGPEFTIGLTKQRYDSYNYYGYSNTGPVGQDVNGTVAGLVKLGLMINPVDKFNITIDGGAGVGDIFGGKYPFGLVGLWHIGLALGTNF